MCEVLSRARRIRTALLLSIMVWLGVALAAGPASAHDHGDAVYTQSNAVPNAIQAYKLHRGALTPVGSFATGGNGDPASAPFAPSGAVSLHASGHALFTINEGSNTVSSFRVRRDSSLELASHVPSGGVFPTSVTSSGNLVYVVNSGDGTISGFTVSHRTGELTPIAGSTTALASPAAPAQISFDATGRVLVVTERGTNVIETFRLRRDGRPGAPTPQASTGQVPYGFAFTRRDVMVVSDAGMGLTDGTVSSYVLNGRTGQITAVDHHATGQGAPCWVSITEDGRFAYVSNAFSSNVSQIALARNGAMTVLGLTPVSGFALDNAVDDDSDVFYVLTVDAMMPTSARIDALRIDRRGGGLTPIASTSAMLSPSATGLAAG